jgi:hypothetical protein
MKKGTRPESAKAKPKAATKTKRITLPTFKGNGALPGVDIYNSAALLDLMDRQDHPEWFEKKHR